MLAGELLDEMSAQLHGYGSTQDRITPLTNSIGTTDVTMTVDFSFGQAVGIAPGIIEIDSEQLYAVNIDSTTNIITVANGFGRGYNGTTAATHAAGARVVSRPKFPRNWMFKQANQVIDSLYPDLFAVKTFTGTVTWPNNTYDLGVSTPVEVLDAQWQDTLGRWWKCDSYTIDPFDGSFRLGGGALGGRPLRVVYTTPPSLLVDETSDFSITGLPSSCAELVILGVVARQVFGLDISRAQLSSVEQSARSTQVPPNAGLNASSYVMKLFATRLQSEAKSLRSQYKPRMVKVF